MKVIDFDTKGNVIKLYYGNDDETEYWGDDWNDKPYEHNAGEVYSRFVTDILEYAFPCDFDVLTPESDWHYHGNSPFSKEDMKNKKCPCIIVKKLSEAEYWSFNDYSSLLGSQEDDVLKIYFNDNYSTLDSKIKEIGGVFLRKGKQYYV